MNPLDLSAIPNFCSHEHWGLTAIRSIDNDVHMGALPKQRVNLINFIGLHETGGCFSGPDPAEAWKVWRQHRHTIELGAEFQCARRGIQALYGYDIAEGGPEVWVEADAAIARAHEDFYGWMRTAMEKVRFTGLVRPVVPEFYVLEETPESAKAEMSITDTVMRLETLLAFLPTPDPEKDFPFIFDGPGWWPPEAFRPLPVEWRNRLAEIAGVMPADPKTWREFIARIFDLAGAKGCLGLKDMRAKNRTLNYVPRDDSEVAWGGITSVDEMNVFQDWVVHECCRHANDRGWAYQIHTGTHNLAESSPLPLYQLARRYPNMKIVLLHCWPFLQEAGWLAKYTPNIYADTCWLPLLNPAFFREAMALWLNYVPLNKIMCGHDAHSVEAAAGSARFTREILGELLAEQGRAHGIGEERLLEMGHDILHGNAAAVYGVSGLELQA